jgi:phosphoenolpyruvate-protein kinase (PTS system EI component)
VSAGARSSATRITGESKEGTPGSGAVVRCSEARDIEDGTPLALDGVTGTVLVEPDEASVSELTERANRRAEVLASPIWEARIAVWLVGPPAAVMRPRTSSGLRVAVSAGARSVLVEPDEASVSELTERANRRAEVLASAPDGDATHTSPQREYRSGRPGSRYGLSGRQPQ